MSHQLPVYMGWKLDPGSQATNAMYQLLAKTFPYPFSPFSLILLVLSKLRKKGTTMICVAPIWQSQAWYSVLLSMYTHNPLLLPHRKDLLPEIIGIKRHFRQSCKAYIQSLLTNRSGVSGLASVVNGRLIPFDVL